MVVGVWHQNLVLNPLASAILGGKVTGGDTIELKVVGKPLLPDDILVASEPEGGQGEAVVMRVKRAAAAQGSGKDLPALVEGGEAAASG